MTFPTWLKLPDFSKWTLGDWVKLASLLLTGADAVLMYGDQINAVPGLPGWVAHLWPRILFVAMVLHKWASVFGIKPTPLSVIEAKVQQAVANASNATLPPSGYVPPPVAVQAAQPVATFNVRPLPPTTPRGI